MLHNVELHANLERRKHVLHKQRLELDQEVLCLQE